MDSLSAYIPLDRRRAIARGENLPDRAHGAALFADISGFTPLTEALVYELGRRRGADELTRQLNIVYGALIDEVHRYAGSIIGFSGDAITCWFDDTGITTPEVLNTSGVSPGLASLHAAACALAMQQVMGQFLNITTPSGIQVSLAIKIGIATGPVRRFRVGDPQIQYLDVLAGATVDRMAVAEKFAKKGEVVVDPETTARISDQVVIKEWREIQDQGEQIERLAVVGEMKHPPEVPQVPTPSIELMEEPLSQAQVSDWLLPPVFERLRDGRGRFLAEIRPAVAMFLKFGGLDYDRDEAAGQKLDAYVRLVQNMLAYYEGYLIQLTIGEKGNYLYAVFGAPLAHDDDPARAVAAALELRTTPAELEFAGGVQIGVSQGRMRVGAYGGLTRRTYGVLGDEVIVAARLMERAEPGQIIVSQRIADSVAKRYLLEHIEPVSLKGMREPVLVSSVVGRRLPSSPRLATRFTSPLVGRDGELAQMEQILKSVLEGEGQIFRLEGAAGVGKSHLMTEFINRARSRDLRVAVGACQSTSQDIPYYPWRQVFRTLFDLSDELSEGEDRNALIARQISQVEAIVSQSNPAWRLRLPLLGDLLGLPIPDNETTAAFDPQLRQEALLSLAVDMVQAWARSRPILLLIEDVHWLDEASQRLTLALGRVIANAPALLALTHRPHDIPVLSDLNRLPEYNHLYLHELSRRGVAGLVTHRLEGRSSALALDLIQALSQGNPFFVEELTNTLRESGRLHRGDENIWILSETLFNTLRKANCLTIDTQQGEWILAQYAPLATVDLDIPDSIHGLVLSSLDHLTAEAKLALKVAGVIGRTFEFDVLAQSHPTQPDHAALQEQLRLVEAQDLIYLEMPPTPLSYTFKHHIIQETVYETLPANQRRELHRAVGETLERLRPDAVERLAYHYQRSGEGEKTLFYVDQAARKTRREYANETALNYYNQALAMEERWKWRQRQVEVLHILGRREEEAAGLQVLATNSGAPALEVAYLQGQYHVAIGDYAQALAAVERALGASQELGNLEGEVRCLAQLGLIAYRQGDYEDSKTWYNRALALFRPEESYPWQIARAFAQVLNGLGFVHSQQGDYGDAQTYYERALALSRQSGDRQGEAEALNNLGVMAFYQRLFAQARTYHQQALDLRRTIGDRAGEGTSLFNLAQVINDEGDYGKAQRYLTAALKILQATGNRWHEVNVWNDLGILYHELGDLSRAQACIEKGLNLAKEIGVEEHKGSYLLSNLGLVMRDLGELGSAEQLLVEGLALVETADNKHQMSFLLSYLSTVSLQAGQLDQAIEQARTALSLRRTLGLRTLATDDLATLAAAHLANGDLDQALDYAEQSLSILDECGGEGVEFPLRDYFVGYTVLEAAGHKERAQPALDSAYSLVTARAEKITDPAMRHSFLEQVAINREIVAEYQRVRTQ